MKDTGALSALLMALFQQRGKGNDQSKEMLRYTNDIHSFYYFSTCLNLHINHLACGELPCKLPYGRLISLTRLFDTGQFNFLNL